MHFSKVAKNEEVCRRITAIEWSITIQKRWLKWFGTVIRAGGSTPAKRAFIYTISQYPRAIWLYPSRYLAVLMLFVMFKFIFFAFLTSFLIVN